MSNTYIKNLAYKYGIYHWHVKKRPELTPKVAAKWLFWYKVRRHQDVQQWQKYIQSDECSMEQGTGKEIEWVQGISIDKQKLELVNTYKYGKQM